MSDRFRSDADEEWATPEEYPRMWNMSAGFIYPRMVRAQVPETPEYLTVRLGRGASIELHNAVAQWNTLWEAAQFRRRFFDEEELPQPIATIADQGDVNVVFVPRTRTRYYEYAPLFHLLPAKTLEIFGLPMLQRGQWPFAVGTMDVDALLPVDFEARLGRAWAATVWRHLMPGSKMRAFSGTDPIRLVAHNLDFWLPHVTNVMEGILRSFPVARGEEDIEVPVQLIDGTYLEGAVAAPARMGSDLWRGEVDAAEVVEMVVNEADANGRLRGILDAVRSNRVEDDFSDKWSFAREDFDRKMHRKRSKVPVTFVELEDVVPVQGPETEVVGQHVLGDFLTLLDERERRIVVLLTSGMTKLTDVGAALGYSNHSAVSKRLGKIRREAERFFDDAD